MRTPQIYKSLVGKTGMIYLCKVRKDRNKTRACRCWSVTVRRPRGPHLYNSYGPTHFSTHLLVEEEEVHLFIAEGKLWPKSHCADYIINAPLLSLFYLLLHCDMKSEDRLDKSCLNQWFLTGTVSGPTMTFGFTSGHPNYNWICSMTCKMLSL